MHSAHGYRKSTARTSAARKLPRRKTPVNSRRKYPPKLSLQENPPSWVLLDSEMKSQLLKKHVQHVRNQRECGALAAKPPSTVLRNAKLNIGRNTG
jgi:hypothetical protein